MNLSIPNAPILDLPFCARYRPFKMSDSSALPKIVTPSGPPSGRCSGPSRIIRHKSLTGSRQSAVTSYDSPVSPLATRHSPLRSYYNALFAAYGPQRWWPGRTRLEIIIGAILTQNTSWKNVERAISNLRRAKLLSSAAVHNVSPTTLRKHLRPSGYFRQKTKTLKTFVDFLFAEYSGSLNRLFSQPTAILRKQLLALRGIGPETADSILLYAGKHPVFVVDAYSRRILGRHALIPPEQRSSSHRHSHRSYEQIRALFESQLPRDPQLFNEFHALIVHTGKHFCRKSDPLCSSCPLARYLPEASSLQPTIRESRATRHHSPVTVPVATSSRP